MDKYKQYQKYFSTVHGVRYWRTIELVFAGIALLGFYAFNIWGYITDFRLGIGITVLLVLLTALAIYGLTEQIKLRAKAKEICKNGKIITPEILDFKPYISHRTINSVVTLMLSSGEKISENFPCGAFGMKKYEKTGVTMITSGHRSIILKAKKYNL